MGSSAAMSLPLSSSKLKAWTGLRKSSVVLSGVGCLSVVGVISAVVVTGFSEGVGAAGVRDFLVVVRGLVEGFLTVLGLLVVLGLPVVLAVALLAGFLTGVFLGVVDEFVVFLGRRGDKPSIDLFLSIVYNYNIMSVKLTKKQLALLEFLEDFTEAQGYSPSYREIMAGMGLTSVSAVAEHVDNLVAKGVLRKAPGAARSLEILDYKHEETVELFKTRLMTCNEEEKQILMKAAAILGLDLE